MTPNGLSTPPMALWRRSETVMLMDRRWPSSSGTGFSNASACRAVGNGG